MLLIGRRVGRGSGGKADDDLTAPFRGRGMLASAKTGREGRRTARSGLVDKSGVLEVNAESLYAKMFSGVCKIVEYGRLTPQ